MSLFFGESAHTELAHSDVDFGMTTHLLFLGARAEDGVERSLLLAMVLAARALKVGCRIFTGQISTFVSTNEPFRQVNAKFGDH